MSNHASYLLYKVLLNSRLSLLNITLIKIEQITLLLQFMLGGYVWS